MISISRNADISLYYEKHRRPRRTTSGVWGATCVSPLIAIQEQEAQWRQPSQTQPRGERVLRLAGTANSCSKNEKPSFGSPHRGIKSSKEGQTRPFRVSSSSARQRYEENSRNRQKSPKK